MIFKKYRCCDNYFQLLHSVYRQQNDFRDVMDRFGSGRKFIIFWVEFDRFTRDA